MSTIIERVGDFVPSSVRQASWMRPRYPLVGVELREDAVLVSRLARRGRQHHLAGHARVELEPGVFRPALLQPAIGNPRKLVGAVQEALRSAGAENATRISVALPDTMARALLVDVQDLPSARSQADEMIRWRIKKSLPFRPEDTRLSWQVLGPFEDGRMHVLVAVAPDSGVRPLEQLLESVGLRVGLVDLATFNLCNALRLAGQLVAAREGDLAVLNAVRGYFSVMILRGERLIFYRSKGYHVQDSFQGEESLRVVGRELRTTLSYYEEHLLGDGIREVLVRTGGGLDPNGFVETVLEAGCSEVAFPELGGLLPEIKGLGDDAASELLPSIGLALRRVS